MAEISLTKWLDPALDYFARESGIPVDQYAAQQGGEGIAVGLEVATDFFTKGWLNKAIQAVAGIVANSYAVWGKNVPARLRRELLALGTHEIFRIADPKPSDIIEVRRSLEDFLSAAQRGDWNAALASILRSPAEIQAMVGVTLPPGPAPTPGPVTFAPTPPAVYPTEVPGGANSVNPVPGSKYTVRQEEAPKGTKSSGRYTVTG